MSDLQNETTSSPAQVTEPRRGTLLIADDEDGPRESVRAICKDDYNILMAANGATAMELARAHHVDVAVLDIRMHKMSGIELLKKLKEFDPDIEVIMMTAFETGDTIRQALHLGASDYLNKPFDVQMFRAAVSSAWMWRSLLSQAKADSKIDRDSIQTRRQEVLRLRLALFDQDLELNALNTRCKLLSKNCEELSEQCKALAAANRRRFGKQLVNWGVGVYRKFFGATSKTASTVSASPAAQIPTEEAVSEEVSREVLTNTTAAFVHKLNNEYVNLTRLVQEMNPDTSAVAEDQGARLAKKHRELLTRLGETQYLLQRFRNTMGRHPGVLRTTDIKAILVDVQQHLLRRFSESVLISLPPPACEISGDKELLWHLFENLIRNALEAVHDRARGEVTVSAEVNARRERVIIKVRDNGPGISPGMLPRIFDMDYTTKPKGMGIGLYLARRAAQIHGGHIECQSELGTGTTFTVSLPLAAYTSK